jgi:hypothetical protein
MRAGVPQVSVLSPTYTYMYINGSPPQTPGVYLAHFADDTCLYATDRKEGFAFVVSQSAQWRPGVSAGLLKLMKIRLRDLPFSQSTARVPSYTAWTKHSICK